MYLRAKLNNGIDVFILSFLTVDDEACAVVVFASCGTMMAVNISRLTIDIKNTDFLNDFNNEMMKLYR